MARRGGRRRGEGGRAAGAAGDAARAPSFQSFVDQAEPGAGAPRVARLRRWMRTQSPRLAGVLVPRADEHQGEYVAPYAERLKWLTGFSGSAGLAIVLARRAALFVDGRYTLQAREEVDTDLFEILQVPKEKPSRWLGEALGKAGKGARIGFDPWLHSLAEIERLAAVLQSRGVRLVPLARNPVDAIRAGRPPPPLNPVEPHPLRYAGRKAADKIADIARGLAEAGEQAAILSLPDSIAWLLNMRGSDIPHTPVAPCFAIVHADSRRPVDLFIDRRKLDEAARAHLEGIARIHPRRALAGAVRALGRAGARVRLDPHRTPWWFARRLRRWGGEISRGEDPCLLPKAIKNRAEIEGARAAHIRDGVAMARFLAWLDVEAPKGRVDEIAAARRLEALRRESGCLREISFDTISGAGHHGAIVHYRVTTRTNRKLGRGTLYLVDSGAQYPDGTTDVTRTVAIGRPTAEMRSRYTLVLKGHIAIATARFPEGTRGADLDGFARRALWEAGLDYDHGTGHGVGSYLSVHEGPQAISKRGTAELKPGMILSNEPGYYKEGAYGIRIENLVLVTEPAPMRGGERPVMGFETLTLVPFDRRLIRAEMLSAAERAWVDAYHARVRKAIASRLSGKARAWLEAATRPLAEAPS